MLDVSTVSPTLDPILPLELEQRVFTTAVISDPETILPLLQVAHRVSVWLGPFLYRTLIFRENPGKSRFTKAFQTIQAIQTIRAKSPAFRHENVRSIMWWESYGEEQILTLLSICSGLENLALRRLTEPMVPCLSSLQLRRLSLPSMSLPSLVDSSQSSFRTLTHLHVYAYMYPAFASIPDLPSLTHLCLTIPKDNGHALSRLLRKYKKLQICVCAFASLDDDDLRGPGPWIEDPRVVIMRLDIDTEDYIKDWKLGAGGRRDFWVHAEEFLAKKQSDPSITTQICEPDLFVEE
ncbi:hypothetical protein DFH06DRAFT_561060 [Mycena polygramma]|nr:hypothetical protein DFH06DRAFT_561060 [Mycena polygramma]